ncbi:MAG: hypothetical protein N3A69_15075, partial [Leptospiraceae bacterium]|nr:hypothetical protein [Leptospiraceae bacterium]
MKNSEEYFSNLLELTLREKEAERKTKDKELTSKSLKEKRKLGIAIYPIEWEIEPYSLEGKILLNLNSKEVK